MRASKLILLSVVSFLAQCALCRNVNDYQKNKYCDVRFEKTDVPVRPWVLNLMARGYQFHRGFGYYKLHRPSTTTWGKAWKQCEEDGAHLLIINSEAEAQEAKGIVSTYPSSYAYIIGFHDHFLEGEFVTIHGTCKLFCYKQIFDS
jgi:hypothetical protein